MTQRGKFIDAQKLPLNDSAVVSALLSEAHNPDYVSPLIVEPYLVPPSPPPPPAPQVPPALLPSMHMCSFHQARSGSTGPLLIGTQKAHVEPSLPILKHQMDDAFCSRYSILKHSIQEALSTLSAAAMS